jgi:hypothetical protein
MKIMGIKNTKWVSWNKRNTIIDKDQPAIYYIAHSTTNLDGNDFSYCEEIVYIGMTISNNGLKGRLDQFEKAMHGYMGVHGGAERVKFKHKDSDTFFKDTYVSACIFKISKNKNLSEDWRTKGDCVGHEYNSFANYMDLFGRLPEFNDQKRSKKK